MRAAIRLAASVVVAAALCGGALAAEPIEIVQALYDAHPHASNPPGGMAAWTPDMQDIWQVYLDGEAERLSGETDFEGEGLVFDFMTGSQESLFESVRLKPGLMMNASTWVQAAVDVGESQPYLLVYGFERDDVDAPWQIADVKQGTLDGDGWWLSDLLQNTR